MKRAYIGDLIQSDLGLVDGEVDRLAKNADRLYRRFITRNRVVYDPDPELKLVQCWISDFLRSSSSKLPEYVAAYEPGCSVRRNALLHAKSAHLIKLDIKHFFPSCKRDMVEGLFAGLRIEASHSNKLRALDKREIDLLSDLSCYKKSLCIGAPSSPTISNRIMLDFDIEVMDSIRSSYIYSRYSDDITISSKVWIDKDEIIEIVQKCLKKYGFELNTDKICCVGLGDQRKITGVFLQPDGNLSIGKKLKEKLKSELYQFLVHGRGESAHILGLINYSQYVDPDWTSSLIAKYNNYGVAKGCGVIKALRED